MPVLVVAVLLLAALAFIHSPGNLVEVLVQFGVLTGMLGLVVVLTLWESRSRGRAYDASWRTVCHVLDEDHRHEGTQLTGTWQGRPFQARATTYSLGQYGGTAMAYRLSMSTVATGPAWKAVRGAQAWTIRSDPGGARREQIDANLLSALEDAEQRTVHQRPCPRLGFHPRTAEVVYEDGSGEPPCPEDLVVHLDLVRRAVAVHEASSVGGSGRPG